MPMGQQHPDDASVGNDYSFRHVQLGDKTPCLPKHRNPFRTSVRRLPVVVAAVPRDPGNAATGYSTRAARTPDHLADASPRQQHLRPPHRVDRNRCREQRQVADGGSDGGSSSDCLHPIPALTPRHQRYPPNVATPRFSAPGRKFVAARMRIRIMCPGMRLYHANALYRPYTDRTSGRRAGWSAARLRRQAGRPTPAPADRADQRHREARNSRSSAQ